MRYPGVVLIMICLIAGGPLHAVAAQDKDAATASQTSTDKAGASDKKGSGQSQKPATTFKPSERIRADSAVSFPVDI